MHHHTECPPLQEDSSGTTQVMGWFQRENPGGGSGLVPEREAGMYSLILGQMSQSRL